MKLLKDLSTKNLRCIFSDIDDTISSDGKISSEAYSALWKLKDRGFVVVPVTGRPAGWCDMIARFWPVDAVIGENGAFYFSYNEKNKNMKRIWAYEEQKRWAQKSKFKKVEAEVLKTVPGSAVSADQFSRLFDLAIDFCEDVPPLKKTDIQKIVDVFKKHGATAKVSSIHVNGWFGDHNKLSMCKTYCLNELQLDLNKSNSTCLFAGDSPNDEPMFEFFENSVGVANIQKFLSELKHPPRFVTPSESGRGFCEIVEHLLKI